ncbi:hypothetical protein ARZXY2_4859 (plasmid) [Arthrobacter sp. ZXY-2]|nr:hypothetical protein ARZXY2_4859 [Arthrobacter sp. ZXY-2]
MSFAEDSGGGVTRGEWPAPLSPVVLAAGEACGAVPDGSLSTLGQGPENLGRIRAGEDPG